MHRMIALFAILLAGTATAEHMNHRDAEVIFRINGGSSSSGMTWKIRTVTCKDPAVQQCSGELEIVTYGPYGADDPQTIPFSFDLYRSLKPNGSLHPLNFGVRSVGGAADPVLLDMHCEIPNDEQPVYLYRHDEQGSGYYDGHWHHDSMRWRELRPVRCYGSALQLGDFDVVGPLRETVLHLILNAPKGEEYPSWARIP